jgi:iron complex outermembrane receptor protein
MILKTVLGATTALGLIQAAPAFAQTAQAGAAASNSEVGAVVVTARRRDELLQNVPVVVNVVSSQTLDKLNIKDLHDITAVVPGLSLTTDANGIGSAAALRGVAFDVNASGNNGTVEFYLNDEPITSTVVLQSLYDVEQIEVLRGPQGTLRGRASPSGSITVTTTRPNLFSYGGYVDATGNNIGGVNVNGAINVPLIPGKLALRVAGLVDDNEDNRVHSVNAPATDPYSHETSYRATLRFDPIDNLDIVANYEHLGHHVQHFNQVESADFADPTQAPSKFQITPNDREAVEAVPEHFKQTYDIYNLKAQYRFAGQKLQYTGAFNREVTIAEGVGDPGGYFVDNGFPGPAVQLTDQSQTAQHTKPNLFNYGQQTNSVARQMSHELILSSDERLFGKFDYVIGGLYLQEQSPFSLWQDTPVFLNGAVPPSPATSVFYVLSHITQSGSNSFEKSLFANVTYHFDDATELSGGVRYIDYTARSLLTILSYTPGPGTPSPVPHNKDHYQPFIYTASINHHFNDNIMAYVSTGTSWRAAAQTNGIIDATSAKDLNPYGTYQGLLHQAPETSTSYEGGVKTQWLDKRLQVNLTIYHQDFTNYFYSSRNVQVAQHSVVAAKDVYTFTTISPAISVDVPVSVNGADMDIHFRPTEHWSVDGTLSYSLSEINNGTIPCNIPGGATTTAQILAFTGGQQVNTCKVNNRAGLGAPFTASFQSEYTHPVWDNLDGFVRGLVTFNDFSANDPLNTLDNIPAYALFNLYFGVQDPHRGWYVSGYVKNLFNTRETLNRDANPLLTSGQALAKGFNLYTGYRGINTTAPQEIGINVKYTFGSR